VEDLITRSQLILKIYCQRTQVALDLFKAQKIGEAIQVLRLRNAAFHNFRVVEHLAKKANLDLTIDLTLKDLFQDLQRLELELLPLAEGYKSKIQLQASRLSEARRKINGYHSGSKGEGHIRNVA
jgi:hypothetical protein